MLPHCGRHIERRLFKKHVFMVRTDTQTRNNVGKSTYRAQDSGNKYFILSQEESPSSISREGSAKYVDLLPWPEKKNYNETESSADIEDSSCLIQRWNCERTRLVTAATSRIASSL